MSRDAEIRQLIAQAKKGDEMAMELIVDAFRPMVAKLANRKFSRFSWGLVEDAIQEGLVEVVKRVKQFDPSQRCAFSTSLYADLQETMKQVDLKQRFAVTRTKCGTAHIRVVSTGVEAPKGKYSKMIAPPDYAMRKETCERVQNAIGQMPPGDQQILVSVMDRVTQKQMAKERGTTHQAMSGLVDRVFSRFALLVGELV